MSLKSIIISTVLVSVICPLSSFASDSQKAVKDMSPMESFGYIKPNDTLNKQKWYVLDQKARKELDNGNFTQAESLWKQAVAVSESNSNIEPGFINSLVGLSLLYHKKGDPKESERLYEYAMRNLEGLAGRNSMKFASYLPDLAWLYHDHGRHEQAELLFKQHLKMHEGAHGLYSPKLIDSLDHYSNFLKKRGRNSEANMLDGRKQDIKYKSNP